MTDTAHICPFQYGNVTDGRASQCVDTAALNYMTSRLRAALFQFESCSSAQSMSWWLDGLRNEVVYNFIFLFF